MAKHAQLEAPWYAWQRVWRTLLQVGIPTVIGLGVVAPQVIQIILEEYGETLPVSVRLWLLAVAGGITATAGVITKVMALPGVNDWLARHTPFGTVPRSVTKE
ncbi:hypothetical protein GCM10022198_00080 [Klugiella xanthotipulae]|uniref:Uncharacterized protein n=1 Tax=Klugiella xanthotipulae TaxID=244735 RepID=A0A543I5N3_9MICO|nr:hypothetical protein [Klugiella xanthotipulae]TQM65851.1 hypothetical protein FB466_0665 [Klugiella xanthotipulae]